MFGRHSISADRWTPLRDKLFKGGLLRTAEAGHFILGRDLNNFTLWDLIQLMGKAPETRTDTNAPVPEWFQRCAEQIETARENNHTMLSTPLAELFNDKKATT